MNEIYQLLHKRGRMGEKKGERDGDNAKHRQGCKTTINSCFRWLETHLQNVVRLGVYSR